LGKAKVLVIGGGPCGCSAAWEIARNGYGVTLVEEKEKLGGLASNQIFNGNVYEYGTHVFHTDQEELLASVSRLMGDELLIFERGSKIHINFMGNYYTYPLQGLDLIKKLPTGMAGAAVLSFLKSFIKYEVFFKLPPRNTEEYLVQKFGNKLYEVFFRDYSHKVWGVPCSELDPSFGAQRIPRSDIFSILKNALNRLGLSKLLDSHPLSEQVIGHIYYAENGIARIFEKMSEDVKLREGEVLTGSSLKKIIVEAGKVKAAVIERQGKEIEISADYYVSTIPLPVVIGSVNGGLPSQVSKAAEKLCYRSISLIGLLVSRPQIRPAYFTYYPKLTFNRLSEPTNHGLKVKQPGHTLLIAETVCGYRDQAWKGDKDFCEKVIKEIVSEGLFEKKDLIEWHHYSWRYSYPVYTVNYRKNVSLIHDYLKTLKNVHSTGRNGDFNYVNMHVAMQMGLASLDQLRGYLNEPGGRHVVKKAAGELW